MLEEELAHRYSQEIRPYFQDCFDQIMVTGSKDVLLRCTSPKESRADTALLLLGGRTEFVEKYGELLFDLRRLDISLYSYDHRGQGMSGRMLDDPQKGHVNRFEDYVEDLKLVLEEVLGGRHRRVFVLAHSMGGAVTALFQLKYPHYLDGAILSSPMFGINCFPLSASLTGWLTHLAILSGRGERYIPGGGPYSDSTSFRNNVFTTSRVRFEINQELYRSVAGAALGAPTNRWLSEALQAAERAVARATDLDLPMLVLQSGDDRVVKATPQRLFAERAPHCRLQVFAGARHELLMERDDLRAQAISEIIGFLRQYGEI